MLCSGVPTSAFQSRVGMASERELFVLYVYPIPRLTLIVLMWRIG